jgi:hypothetical protein
MASAAANASEETHPHNPRFLRRNPNFPRYIAPDFLQYLCERTNKPTKTKTEEQP